jgi:hypothetical protein
LTNKSEADEFSEKTKMVDDPRILEYSDYSSIIFVLVGWLMVFFLFTRNLQEAAALFLTFVLMGFLPGFCIVIYSLQRPSLFENSLLASFIGIWVIPLLMYCASFFMIHAVSIWFSILIAVISVVFTILHPLITRKK